MARINELQEENDYLQGCIDEARDVLDQANTVTATREELAQAVLDALDSLSPDEDETEDEEADSDEGE